MFAKQPHNSAYSQMNTSTFHNISQPGSLGFTHKEQEQKHFGQWRRPISPGSQLESQFNTKVFRGVEVRDLQRPLNLENHFFLDLVLRKLLKQELVSR